MRLRGVRRLKTTFAAVAAYAAALPLSANDRPVIAPLTALLVVQLTCCVRRNVSAETSSSASIFRVA